MLTLVGLVGRQALRYYFDGKLLFPRAITTTMQSRAFSVFAPSVWNSLPLQIRWLPNCNTPLFYKLLKTDLFHLGWTGSASVRAFSVFAPSVWNSLPLQIRWLPNCNTPLFYKLLKTDLFHLGWTGSASVR